MSVLSLAGRVGTRCSPGPPLIIAGLPDPGTAGAEAPAPRAPHREAGTGARRPAHARQLLLLSPSPPSQPGREGPRAPRLRQTQPRPGTGRGRAVTARLFKMSAGGARSGRRRARERAALRRGGRPGAP